MPRQNLLSAAGYLPLLRFDKAVARSELRWSGLGGSGKGQRAVAGWDEDSLTMAVEAVRLLPEVAISGLTFGSTSAGFTDRSQAGLIVDALNLPPTVLAQDVAGSRRAATSALLRAFQGSGTEVVAAGEKRKTMRT